VLGLTIIIVLICAGKLSFSREWFAVGRVLGNSLGMRREVHYTLALTRWLALEGGRCASVEELWSNLVFASQRLGFNYVRLTLGGEKRVWEHAGETKASHSARHELQAGRLGILELRAPACDVEDMDAARACSWPSDCHRPCCPCVSQERVFEIVSELLVEGWAKAAIRWNSGTQAPLKFDARITRPRNEWQYHLAGNDAGSAASKPSGNDLHSSRLNDPTL